MSILRHYSKGKTKECNESDLCFSEDCGIFMPTITTYSLEVGAHAWWTIATDGLFTDKRISEISIFDDFILDKNGGVRPK